MFVGQIIRLCCIGMAAHTGNQQECLPISWSGNGRAESYTLDLGAAHKTRPVRQCVYDLLTINASRRRQFVLEAQTFNEQIVLGIILRIFDDDDDGESLKPCLN